MNFLNPWALLGLTSVPIIIGLHLHLERNRRVVVSSIFLWAFLDAKFEGQKPKFVQLSWLLLLDISIAVLLSLAFAQPVLKLPTLGGKGTQRAILIDNSISMLSRDGNPDRLSIAKEIAIGIIEDANRRDESIVITVGGNAEFIGGTKFTSKETLIKTVGGLRALGTGVDLRAGLSIAQGEASSDLPLEVYVITDAAFEQVNLIDFPLEIKWVFVGFDQNNQAVVNPVLKVLESKSELFFKLVNYGTSQVERDLQIKVNQQLISQTKVTLSPLSVMPQQFSLTGRIEAVEIQLSGEDMLVVDDIARLTVVPDPIVSVALVTENPDPIDRAISSVPGTDLKILAPFEYSINADYDLVVFRGVLPEKWPSGKVLVFDPPVGNPIFEITGLDQISAPIVFSAHKLLEGLDLSTVRWGAIWLVPVNVPGERIIQAGGLPLLLTQMIDDCEVFFFLPQLSSGNFTKHPTFPLFLASMVEHAKNFSPEQYYQLSETIDIAKPLQKNTISLQLPSADENAQVIDPLIHLDEIGFYNLELTNRNGVTNQFQFGVNAGEFLESNITPRDWRLKYAEANSSAELGIQSIEINFSPWLLLLVAVLLVTEAWRAWR